MTLLPGRLARVHSPCRIFARLRHASMMSTRSGPRPTRRGGRNLGSRYQWLESSIRTAARQAALLKEMADTSHLLERRNSAPARGSRASSEGMEVFHGLVIPEEPKPPESDGELFASHHFEVYNKGFRVKNVVCLGVRFALMISTRSHSQHTKHHSPHFGRS